MKAPQSTGATERRQYWRARQLALYYQAVFQVVSVVGDEASSILDVGSADTDYINWFDWIPKRTQLNLGFRSDAPAGVERIATDFLTWTPPHKYDVVLCMQVLEHVDEVEAFCAGLKVVARGLVVSVPYKWREGGTKGHIHDPVDEAKLAGWMQLKPNHWLIVPEPFGPKRLIAYYDIEGGPQTRIPRAVSRERIACRGQTRP